MQIKKPEVLEELAEFEKIPEERNKWMYLNNFTERLPGTVFRRLFCIKYPLNSKPSQDGGYSELCCSQTETEFHATIDAILKEMDIFDEVDKLNRDLQKDYRETSRLERLSKWIIPEYFRSRKRRAKLRRLYELVTPIYFIMRDMGYNSYPDLTA